MKNIYVRFLMINLMIYLFSTVGMGQSFGHIHNEDPDGLLPSKGCIYKVNVSLTVANLEKFNTPDIDGNYRLPKGYEDLIIQYSIDGNLLDDNANLSTFKYNADFTALANNGIKYYTATHYIDQIDFIEQCASVNENGQTKVPYIIQLRTQGGSNYPICQYTSVGDIFACNAFTSTTPYCDNISSSSLGVVNVNCNSADLASVSNEMDLTCGVCSNQNTEAIAVENVLLKSKQPFETILLSPNPFNNKIQLSWTNNDSIEEAHLFDATGKRLKSQYSAHPTENGSLYFNTDNLPPGLYFLQVKNKLTNKTFRLVKH